MSQVNALISQRLKKGDPSAKMSAMAKQSASGNRSTFSGMFTVAELSDGDRTFLETLLQEFQNEESSFSSDLRSLSTITAEVKAINHQASLLHGERIKRAQLLLKTYKEGAFSTWLVHTYGNRQTPYNLLQYYEFWEEVPKDLHPTLEKMPRQAIYTLAARPASLDQKLTFVQSYQGQTKHVLLQQIRELFPLKDRDLRKEDLGRSAVLHLQKILDLFSKRRFSLKKEQKQHFLALMEVLNTHIDEL